MIKQEQDSQNLINYFFNCEQMTFIKRKHSIKMSLILQKQRFNLFFYVFKSKITVAFKSKTDKNINNAMHVFFLLKQSVI